MMLEYDGLERMAHLLCKGAWHHRRDCRKQTADLGRYVEALGEYDVATEAVAARPHDPEANDALHRASEALNKAREELRR